MKTYDTNISYTEKYFSSETEKRIRRMQFLWRILSFPILLGLMHLSLNALVLMIFSLSLVEMTRISAGLTAIMYVFLLLFALFCVSNIVKKRCHDFGQEGKLLSLFVVISSVLTAVVNIYASTVLAFSSGITLFTGIINVPPLIQMCMQIVMYIGLIEILVLLYLLFRPGTKGVNEYGEDRYYKSGLLG